MVLKPTTVWVDCDSGSYVPCHNVAVEFDYVSIQHSFIGVGEGEFINSPED